MQMDSKQIQTLFFGLIFVFLFFLVAHLLSPFFTVILWSALLYIVFGPLFHRLVAPFDLSKGPQRFLRKVLAACFSLGSVVLIVVPLGFVGIQLVKQTTALISEASKFLETNRSSITDLVASLSGLLNNLGVDPQNFSSQAALDKLNTLLSSGFDVAVRTGASAAKDVGLFVIALAFMAFTLYFFYVDGEYLLSLVVKAIPIRTDYMKQLVLKFREIIRNLVVGYLLVAFFQALMAYLIFRLFKVEGALVFSVLLLFCSFIPMIGAGAVWLPLGIVRIISGDLFGGVLFLILCGIFISTLDNFLRPLFLRDRIKLHPLIIFFSILGGVSAFGFNGLVLGPLIVILFLTVLDLFLLEHGFGEASGEEEGVATKE